MGTEEDKKLLDGEIADLNEKIEQLGYQLSGLLNIDCSFGVCNYDPIADDIQEKLKEVQEKKELLQRLKKHISSGLK
ncbi:MAG: hypothetical protein JRI52_08200 [Deltaproteobacteria bacterium]|nr:hypothetical protein [Deltaproteobacteria bacterium]